MGCCSSKALPEGQTALPKDATTPSLTAPASGGISKTKTAATSTGGGGKDSIPKNASSATVPATQSLGPILSKKSTDKIRSSSGGGVARTSSKDDVDTVYQTLFSAQSAGPNSPDDGQLATLAERVTQASAAYQNPTTKSTPLHLAVRLLDLPIQRQGLPDLVHALLEVFPDAAHIPDATGHIPLHYAVAPQTYADGVILPAAAWESRKLVLRLLLQDDTSKTTMDYLGRNNISFAKGLACTALYRALQTLPDDFDMVGPTVSFIRTLVQYAGGNMVGMGNASDGDKPLALLYRRFTRQFDLAEKFFSGDNSRPEVVEYRKRYKTAASNTWKIIEILLMGDSVMEDTEFRTVHRAVRVETPPDLLRYIVETNAEDLAQPDEEGKLPLHYAAQFKPRASPAFYSKYVVDELLYKFPEAAAQTDRSGNYPLVLGAHAGKQWIGGGIKSLYEAYPDAIKQVDLDGNKALKKALSLDIESQATEDTAEKEEKVTEGATTIIRDQHHDAIMLVQQPDVDVFEVVTSLWAYEEDPGVQMLGCVALARILERCRSDDDILAVALSAVPAVVNAMKAHPNEVIVQEKACLALKGMACCDGRREVSFVASGAVAAIVGAMQAHVSDPGVQEEACAAITKILQYGGDDRATIVASVSGLTALVNAIAAHPTVRGVQQHGCMALKVLTDYETANLPELPQSQVEPLLETARSKYPVECGETVTILMKRLTP